MASDFEDLTTFYANLPSIFENYSSSSEKSSYNPVATQVNEEKSYQPMFGSFLFADSDPLSRAVFIATSSPSIEVGTTQERLMDDCASSENNISSSIQTIPSSSSSSPSPSAPVEEDMDDEDDFDGIPIRHAPIMVNKKLNGDNNSMLNQSKLNELINRTDNSHDYIDDDSFLNDFTDEQDVITPTTTTIPSLFKDIPDIDDPNEHEEEYDDQLPCDHMDVLDLSDSIRSSSPDSLLSSSHLRNDQDEDIDDDDVTQWNDDSILNTNSLKKTYRSNPPLILHMHSNDQVDFIDSSRSNSRCSNASSRLSIGYADQARIFLSDDGLVTSSDSDEDDNDDVHCGTMNLDKEDSEEPCLQINLDDHRPRSSSSSSICSSLSICDETPIAAIDESESLQTAPIAILDDDDYLQRFTSDRLTTNIKNLIELKNEKQRNEIVHDIINIRHLFNEHVNDDEFIAVIHNPSIFEQVLQDQQKSDLLKQINSVANTFRPSSQLSIDNKIKKESFEHHRNPHQTSSFLESNNEKPLRSSHTRKRTTRTTSTTKTVNNSSSTTVNHLTSEDEEGKANDASVNADNALDTPDIRQKNEQLQWQWQQKPTNDNNVKQFTNGEKHYQIMNFDSESDDDSELLKTLSQLHGIINPTRSSVEQTTQLSSYSSSNINQEKNSSDFSYENRIPNGNEIELLNKTSQDSSHIILSAPSYVIDIIKKSDEEQEEKDEKKNVIFYKNHNNVDGDDKQKEKCDERKEEKNPTTLFSLTSSTSPILFNGDESHSTDVTIDPDISSSLPNLFLLSSSNERNNDATLFSNRLITDGLQISNTKINMNNLPNDDFTQQTTSNLFDPFAPTTNETIVDSKNSDMKQFDIQSNSNSAQPLSNYNFDDLWNQSMSHISSPNNHEVKANNDFHPNTIAWDSFLTNNNNNNNTTEETNPFNDNTIFPTSTLTWESLFGEEDDGNDLKNYLHWIISHLDTPEEINEKNDLQPLTTFIETQNSESIIKEDENNLKNYQDRIINRLDSSESIDEKNNDFNSLNLFIATQNLESIINDIEIHATPFGPILSPPLHVDHTVSNPFINGTHHDLFPIDEAEQPNFIQQPQSMILYEEEEEEEEEENNNFASSDSEITSTVEKLVSNTLQLALAEVNGSNDDQVGHFVDQILAEAIFQVHNEDNNLSESNIDDNIPTENLASIISWHDRTQATNKQLLDPFDQKFDSIWSTHFEAPDDITNENIFQSENKTVIDPWSTTTARSNNDAEPMSFFSKTLDDSDLFSAASIEPSKIPEIEDDETTTLSEYLPPTLLTNPSNAAATNNLMKYTLTAPVLDDSGDDSSTIEDYFSLRKNEEPLEVEIRVNKTDDEAAKQNDFFANDAQFSQFDPFDLPVNRTDQIQQSIDDNTPWTSVERQTETIKSSGIGDDEPWELEDVGEEKISPVPTTSRLAAAFNDNEFSTTEKVDLHNNFFPDAFNPLVTTGKSSRDNKENDEHQNSEHVLLKNVRFDDNVQNIRAATPTKHYLDHTESLTTSEIEVDEITPTFESSLKPEFRYESAEMTPHRKESEELPPPLLLNDKTSN